MALGFGVALLASSASAPAQSSSTTGKITVQSKSVALGIGVSWGDGVLTYHGKKYPFTIEGLSVVDLGISKVNATGTVKNLKKVEDFTGNYVAAQAGAAVAGGAGTAVLKNQNGVEITVKATSQGVKLTVGGSGVDVKLKQ
jgi:hypothetical protein